jgi:hypothetical protein
VADVLVDVQVLPDGPARTARTCSARRGGWATHRATPRILPRSLASGAWIKPVGGKRLQQCGLATSSAVSALPLMPGSGSMARLTPSFRSQRSVHGALEPSDRVVRSGRL